MKKLHIAALVLALAFGLCACGGEGVEAPNSAAPVETASPTATPTASPEATATPTPTPSPTVEPSPEASPEATAEPTPTAKATQKPNVPQQNLSDNAEKNVKIPQRQENPVPDGSGSFTESLPVIEGGPKDGSSGTGVVDEGQILTDEEVWDPERKVDFYLGKDANQTEEKDAAPAQEAENVSSANQDSQYEYTPVEIGLGLTGEEMFNQIEQWAKEGY